jgi:hypothetical protein
MDGGVVRVYDLRTVNPELSRNPPDSGNTRHTLQMERHNRNTGCARLTCERAGLKQSVDGGKVSGVVVCDGQIKGREFQTADIKGLDYLDNPESGGQL